MNKACECEVVKKYDDVYQCMMCRKNFLPSETVNDQFVKWLDDHTANASVTGNLLVIVMKLDNNEINLYEDLVDERFREGKNGTKDFAGQDEEHETNPYSKAIQV